MTCIITQFHQLLIGHPIDIWIVGVLSVIFRLFDSSLQKSLFFFFGLTCSTTLRKCEHHHLSFLDSIFNFTKVHSKLHLLHHILLSRLIIISITISAISGHRTSSCKVVFCTLITTNIIRIWLRFQLLDLSFEFGIFFSELATVSSVICDTFFFDFELIFESLNVTFGSLELFE